MPAVPDKFFHTIDSVSAEAKDNLALPSAGSVYDAYAALMRLAKQRRGPEPDQPPGLGGWLLAVFSLHADGIAALVAGAVAGAAVLGMDAERERGKQLLRYGVCDFLVNDLDEALRILKNEVRKRQPVSVCLTAEPPGCGRAMVERGVQPEILAGRWIPEAEPLRERGAVWLEAPESDGCLVTWKPKTEGAGWAAGPLLGRADALAVDALDAAADETPWRRAWLQRAPRFLGRKLGTERGVRMSDAEAARLAEAIGQDEALAEKLILTRDGAVVDR